MKITPKNIRKFQEGGPMPEDPAMMEEAPMEEAPAEAPAGPEGGDPLMQIAEMAMLALLSQDCNMAMQVCQAFMQLVQQAQGGGGTPAEAPAEPVFRRGGKLAYRIRK